MSEATAKAGKGSILGAGIVGFVLIAGPLIAFIFFLGKPDRTQSIGLGALEVLVVLSTTLAGLIIVFQALGLANQHAPLGLPKGSVRALLAFSLVVLFVAVASWNLGGFLNNQAGSINETQIPSSSEERALQAFQDRGFGAYVAKREGETITITYVSGPNSEARARSIEMARDIMTVVATVLVTVVGFYFGSSSTVDGVNSAHATIQSVKSALFDKSGGASDFAAADVSRAADATRAIAIELRTQFEGLGIDPTDLLKEAVEKDKKLKPRLDEAAAAYQAMKKASREATVYADNTAKVWSSVTTDTDQTSLNEAGVKVTGFQDDAKKSKDDFDAQMKKFAEAREVILGETAVG